MLENWLKPHNDELIEDFKNCFGENVDVFDGEVLKNAKIALISVDDENSKLIKKQLFGYGRLFPDGFVVDLGVIKKKNDHFIIGILKELIDSDIIPIIIGDDDEKLIHNQVKAYNERNKLPTTTVIDARICYSIDDKNKGYLNDVLQTKSNEKGLFHLSLLANQAHLIDSNVWNSLEFQDFDLIRLGMIRGKMEDVEPIIRESETIVYHINAIRDADAPAQQNAVPSGLNIEEACQLARYAGISDKTTSIGFYGFCPQNDFHHRTAKSIAAMIWYFIEGVVSRKGDYPISMLEMTEYVVDVNGFPSPMTFWKSNKTQRWWIQITNDKTDKNFLLACSYNDYKDTCNGEIPERIWNGMKRFS